MTSISAAEPGEWAAALALLQGPSDAATRRTQIANGLQMLASGELDSEGLLVARVRGRLVGVQLAAPLAGSGGVMWPPVVDYPADWELENRLTAAGLRFLAKRRVKVVHAILPDLSRAAPLVRAGLKPMTHLYYFQHDLENPAHFREPDWNLTPFNPDAAGEFQRTLLATYEGTLDCPELNGMRTAEEILAGHRAQGEFQAERWRLVEVEQQAIGVVLLNAIKNSTAWDLSYVGVTPEWRGQGWGKRLIRWALHAARQGGATELQVAVDERNQPALRVYRALGFVEVGRRVALLHVLEPS